MCENDRVVCSFSPRRGVNDCDFSFLSTVHVSALMSCPSRVSVQERVGVGQPERRCVCMCVEQKRSICMAQNVSVLVQRRGAISGPEELDVRPLGL